MCWWKNDDQQDSINTGIEVDPSTMEVTFEADLYCYYHHFNPSIIEVTSQLSEYTDKLMRNL